ncbi:unnamed protein product [Caenorhabditis auriculariae]|uniref:Methylated-DNA--protein-cysteine methyltransferase n=1 Tax=Caenorhabditis auriculariae TaxID=2777116 RepID=A0A8S1HCM4_9PELO|nr:unnamed protein product [Caenorhabditis auriculariae]
METKSSCVYDVLDTRFGQVLISEFAKTSKLVAVYFYEGADTISILQETFPSFSFSEGQVSCSDAVIKAINSLHCGLKIDIYYKTEGEFTLKVLEYLRTIPRGHTQSYSQIAAAIGHPTAARAVARACATNNVAYLIPCHRVIASNGSVSGYRWGIEKKKKILKAEGAEISHCVM